MPADNNYFSYMANRTQPAADPFGIAGPTPETKTEKAPGIFSPDYGKEKKGSFGRKLRKIADIGIKGTQKFDTEITRNAQEYAQFLAGQVGRGERSPIEASDLYADFGLAYGVPGAFKTAAQLGSMAQGTAPTGTVERMRDFQEWAAKSLGISWGAEDVKGVEAAALAMNKTSPEAFARLLGQSMLNSPEYIKKNPLAFSANLPFQGYYGVGYQAPGGGFTGTYRFKPPTTVSYD